MKPRARSRLGILCTTMLVAVVPIVASAQMVPFNMALHSSGFELIMVKKGIHCYKHRTSNNIHIAVEGKLPAPPSVVQEAVTDYPRQIGVVERLAEVKVLERGPGYQIVYQRLSLPVISDRDYVVRVITKNVGTDRVVSFSALRDRGPGPKKGIVRVTHHKGSWQLRPVSGGRETWVRFQSTIDLGGWLPRWMARSKAGSELPKLFSNLCHMVCDEQRSESCSSKCP